MKKRGTGRRILALILVLVMVFAMLPVTVFAKDITSTEEQSQGVITTVEDAADESVQGTEEITELHREKSTEESEENLNEEKQDNTYNEGKDSPTEEEASQQNEESSEADELSEKAEEEDEADITLLRAPTLFQNLQQQVQEARDGDELVLDPGEYLFTEALKIEGKELIFKARGNSGVVFKRDESYSSTMFHIGTDGGLTLHTGITMDGENRENSSTAGFINVKGTLTIEGAIFQNEKHRDGIYCAPIRGEGEDCHIVLKDGIIQGNDYSGMNTAYSSGGILVADGATLTMYGGTIQENQASNYQYNGILWSASPGGGAINVQPGGHLEINGGVIRNNKGGSTVFVGSVHGLENILETEEDDLAKPALATAVFNGGTISNNHGVYGGGICGMSNVDISIPENSTLLVADNTAYQGGGVLIMDMAVSGMGGGYGSGTQETAKFPLEIWNKYYAGKFFMAGGTIKGNTADRCGGGINLSTSNARIVGGVIDSNTSGNQGGGIYLTAVPYTLHLENAYISGNKTESGGTIIAGGAYLYSRTGGGVWFCPTGSAVFHVEKGAFIDTTNDAPREANGLYSSKKASDKDYSITLAERAISGGKIEYWTDNYNVRKGSEESQKTSVKNYTEKLAVKTVLSDDFDRESVEKLSKLKITNNTSHRGGGIGSNGNIIFGTEGLKDLEVIKKWEDGTTPEEIEIELRGRLGDLDWLIEKVKLNEENDFKYTFKDLPETIGGEDMEDVVYIKENASSAYQMEISKIKEIQAPNILSFKLNRPEFSGNESIHTVYTNYHSKHPETGVFDEDKWELNNFQVKHSLYQDDTLLEEGFMEYSADGFSWSGVVDFQDIPIRGDNVEVQYYDDDGTSFKPYLLEYKLYLEEHEDKVILKVPRLEPTNDGGNGKVIGVEDIKLNPYENRVFQIIITNKPDKPIGGGDVTEISVNVKKVWEDDNDKENKRPGSVTVHLLADGEDTGKTLVLSKDNGWQGSFDDLLKYDGEHKIVYTIKEEPIEDYETSIAGDMTAGFTVTNRRTPPDTPETPPEPPIPSIPPIPSKPSVPSIPIIPQAGAGR